MAVIAYYLLIAIVVGLMLGGKHVSRYFKFMRMNWVDKDVEVEKAKKAIRNTSLEEAGFSPSLPFMMIFLALGCFCVYVGLPITAGYLMFGSLTAIEMFLKETVQLQIARYNDVACSAGAAQPA